MSEHKNIVICCDGTGNEFGAENSNVVKLYTCLRVDKDQVAYYHPGVGTMGAPNRPTKLGQLSSKIRGLAFGAGFHDNIADAYRFLMREYQPGARVFLFGFSRGAYTIRALAAVLHVYGLLCPGNEGHIPYLLRDYSRISRAAFSRGDTHLEMATAFKQTFSRDIDIHFSGLWDTVSSIGWVYDPVKLLFEGRNPIVRTGRHAVSIDERRCYFQANLWGAPLFVERPEGKSYQQDIVQAWFAGVHSDVGGSYPQSECAPAEDALRWILDEAVQAGLNLEDPKCAAVSGQASPGFEGIAALYRPPVPFTRLHNSLTWKWWFPELLPHVYFDAKGKKRLRFEPWPHRRELPLGALFHPSVHKRREAVGYDPPNVDFASTLPYPAAPSAVLAAEGIAGRADLAGFSVYIPDLEDEASSATPKAIATGVAAVALLGISAAWLLRRR